MRVCMHCTRSTKSSDDEARAEGERFVQLTAAQWRSEEPSGAADYCTWILDSTPLRCPADREHLRKGLQLAGLPA